MIHDSIYHRIDKVGEPVQLRCPAEGSIALRSIQVTVGWYTFDGTEQFQYSQPGRSGGSEVLSVRPVAGLYNFQAFSKMMTDAVRGLTLTLTERTGKVRVGIPSGMALKLPKRFWEILGITPTTEWVQAGRFDGDTPVHMPIQLLNVQLAELYPHANLYNDTFHTAASTFLQRVQLADTDDIAIGQTYTQHFPNPAFKRLKQGTRTLTATICDSEGKEIDNRGLPISFEFEIRQ